MTALVPSKSARPFALKPATTNTTRCFSESGGGIMGKIRDKWDERNAKAQEKKFMEQMEKMASAEKWTLQDFNEELKETLGSWRNKIPGMSGMSQVKAAKQTQQVIEAVIDQVGPEATAQDLQNLGRQEKVSVFACRVVAWLVKARSISTFVRHHDL